MEGIAELVSSPNNEITLADGTIVRVDLKADNDIPVDIDALVAAQEAERSPYTHTAVHARTHGGHRTDPISLSTWSETTDRVLTSVLDDLKDANRQFTGLRTSIICCFVPEVGAFEGLESDSALMNMTALFSCKHARDCVCRVLYSSDSISRVHSRVVSSFSPALTFDGETYNTSLGPCPKLIYA